VTYRIVIPCREDKPEQRHRWLDREHYLSTPDHRFTDKWCQRCGRWFVDVVEHPDDRMRR
jgi:hypothetical protein